MPPLSPPWLASFRCGKGDKAEEGEKTKIAKPHRLLYTSDVVKEILLCLEMRPLTNCQRVCRLWRDVVEASDTLHRALFLKASQRQISSSDPSERNPLVSKLIWPNLQNYKEAQHRKRRLPKKHKKHNFFGERAYLRPEANWRRMLLQQPPTGRNGITELLTDQQRVPNLSIISRQPNDNPTFLRMHHLIAAIEKGVLTALRSRVFAFLATKSRNASLVTWDSRDQIWYAWSQDYFGCDFMIFTVRRLVMLDEACARGKPWPRCPTELDVWYHEQFGLPYWPEPTTKSIPLHGTTGFFKRYQEEDEEESLKRLYPL